VVLSRDETVGNGDDVVIGNFAHQGVMPAGSEYAESRIITLPAELSGRFHLYVKTDAEEAVYEYSEAAPQGRLPFPKMSQAKRTAEPLAPEEH
jgi:hypothetical protein